MDDSKKRTEKISLLAEKLKAIDTDLATYRRENNYSLVFGEGSVHASVMFIGEAPGRKEAETGRPFIGMAGKVLTELLTSVGLSREDVYITSILKDRPPKNRDPKPSEVLIHAPYLDLQIEIIKPKILVLLGRHAMSYILRKYTEGVKGTIAELHGKSIEGKVSYGKIYILPVYHPAAVFYNRKLSDILFEDFKQLQSLLTKNG